MDVLLINGPNLNLLGTRKPEVYGSTTLADVQASIQAQAKELGLGLECFQHNHLEYFQHNHLECFQHNHLECFQHNHLECFQHNHEGGIVDRIHEAKQQGCRSFIINQGAYTHTSVAIRDAFEGVDIPFVELHISNVHAREPFRHHSHLSPIAAAIIVGCGVKGYNLALDLVAHRLDESA